MFKKSCYDFCVLQTERQDGDKYVLATSSVDTGLPNPFGVQRVQVGTITELLNPFGVQRGQVGTNTGLLNSFDVQRVQIGINAGLSNPCYV